ncbi:MAG: DUF5518 domain-containing protein [Haloarculaceae archaeon]
MSETWVNAVAGGIVTLVLAPVLPFAPVLGGALAGYLEAGERGTRRPDGFRVGALAGVVAFVALLVFAVLLGNLLFAVLTGLVGVPQGFVSGLGLLVFVVGAVFGALYVVGLSAVGGWLGVYVFQEL